MGMFRVALFALTFLAGATGAESPEVYFQAHRGGLEEVPENTLVALEYAWGIPGAVPEVDIRTTQDGVPIIIHDDTPARTTNAPPEWAGRKIREIPYEELRQWDAGASFDPAFAGAPVPRLDEVLALLKASPERQLYLDLKDIDTESLIRRLKDEQVTDRVIFVHGSPEMCKVLSEAWPGARTMTWLSGDPERIMTRFRALAADGFPGISQIQLHLRPAEGGGPGDYELSRAFLKEAMDGAKSAGVALQIRPFVFDPPAMGELIDLGVRWYVADGPKKLREAIDTALAQRSR